jgi:O-acetyl-ADP-ribose deacetylase (regulator of RNase III)
MAEKVTVQGTLIQAVLGDITCETVEAIVNAANSGLMGGGGVDGAIHRAGGPAILDDCRKIVSKIGRLPPGKAVITGAGKMAAKYVIHTVGPVWHGGNSKEADILASCYRECLVLASSHNIKSIAFPAISTGIYGYPSELAADIAVATVSGYINNESCSIDKVRFVLYDKGSYNIYLDELERLVGNS